MSLPRFRVAFVLSVVMSCSTACSDGGVEVPPPADSGADAAEEAAVDSGTTDTTTDDTGVDSATDSDAGETSADAEDASDADDAADAAEDGATCATAADCPGTDTDCAQRTCTSGVCSITFTASGTALSAQTAGDCKTAQCDGAGGVVQIANTADVPVDGNECTDDVCTGTVPSNPAKSSGAACGTGGSRVCNGSGACVECVTASTCPGTDSECATRTCTAGVCGMNNAGDGTAVGTQVAGDCKKIVCNGSGGTRIVNDDADSVDDGNPCTTDECSSGTPTHTPLASGTACGTGRVCNSEGACVGCLTASDCPGTDSECATRTCTAGTCGFSYASAGTVLSTQTAGDCKERQCDGSGGIVSVNADTDLPVDTNSCTSDVCTSGVPSNPLRAAGSACTGGGVCTDTGSCVQCLTASDCPGTDSDCAVRTCTANVCGLSYAPTGTPTSTQTAGDCKENQCDGAGNTVSVNVAGDVVDDGNDCTTDVCTAGAPSHPNKAAGTSCSSGAGACNGSGTCEPFTVWIAHVGDGAAALGGNATAAFLDKVDINVSTLTATLTRDILALPTATSGSNRRLTLAGTASTEGALALSGDGRYVTIAGYDAAVGSTTPNTQTSASVNRVIARIDASLAVDTTTALTGSFSGTNIRSAVTYDGTSFWAGGGTGGTRFVPLGGGTETIINTTPGNERWLNIFGGQLYGSSGATSYTGIFTIGTGLPATSGQTAALLPGMTTTSPYGFVMLDRNSSVAGLDTLYVADDGSTTSGGVGGLQKWTFDGTTWTKVATFTAYTNGTSTVNTGYRGVTARVIDNKVYLVAMTSSTVVLYVDDGSGTVAPAKIIATISANTSFRGVSLAPHN